MGSAVGEVSKISCYFGTECAVGRGIRLRIPKGSNERRAERIAAHATCAEVGRIVGSRHRVIDSGVKPLPANCIVRGTNKESYRLG